MGPLGPCDDTLARMQDEAIAAGRVFTIPGLAKILALAGVSGKRVGDGGTPIAEPLPTVDPPPSDLVELQRMVREFRARIANCAGTSRR